MHAARILSGWRSGARWGPLILLAAVAAWVFPAPASGFETIGGEVACRAETTPEGRIRIIGEYRNRGSSVNYGTTTYITFGSGVEISGDPVDIPAGGNLPFTAVFDVASWVPGDYTAVVVTVFEDRGGRSHKVYRLFPVRVNLSRHSNNEQGVTAVAAPVRFNPKRFWRRNDRNISLELENTHSRSVAVRVFPYLKDGYRSPRGAYDITVMPGRKERSQLPVMSSSPVDSEYLLEIQYEVGGRHFSRVLSGEILSRPRPAYFIPYLWLCGALLGIVGVYCALKRDETAQEDPPF